MSKGKLWIALALCVLMLSACGGEVQTPSTEAQQIGTGCWLDVSAEIAEDRTAASLKYVVPETDQILYCQGLTDPKILVDGSYIPLEKAVSDGHITPDLAVYYARQDALAGNCEEQFVTKNGLTHFVYMYRSYALIVVHDVYETPKRGNRVISRVTISDRGGKNRISNNYRTEDGQSLSAEDWGLEFEVKEVTSTGMILRITQSGGQHNGQLCVGSYAIAPYEWEGDWWATATGDYSFANTRDERMIVNNGVTEMYIGWGEVHGECPSGRYEVRLFIDDEFDPGDVHPLTRDYTEDQMYIVPEVVIP